MFLVRKNDPTLKVDGNVEALEAALPGALKTDARNIYALIAQRTERMTTNHEATGSNPVKGAPDAIFSNNSR
jgi:hypothetical protein